MQDRVAISAGTLRIAAAAVGIWLTASVAFIVAPSPVDTHVDYTTTTAALESCAHDELCAAVLAMPACTQTVFCIDVLDWIATSQAVAVIGPPPVIRARTLGLNPRYMMRRLPAGHPIKP